tara:strand:+ start:2687 stop:3157 length:471 start_codon:yes stop_codon:yes gene_type:complete
MDVSREDFLKVYENLHEQIFNENCYSCDFVDSNWIKFSVGFSLDGLVDVFPFVNLLVSSFCDSEIIITDIETIPSHQFTKIVGLNSSQFRNASCSLLGHFQSHLFGQSGKWGIICTLEEESYLGFEGRVDSKNYLIEQALKWGFQLISTDDADVAN